MTQVMQGVRILEVAEQTFVPAASALLADWGAEVVKVEHVERGDAMRGWRRAGSPRSAAACTCCSSTRTGASRASGSTWPLPKASTSSTSSPPPATSSSPTSWRASARSSRSTSRTSGPTTRDIIYCRGSGQGERGPDADKGAYDSLAFWSRAAVAASIMRQGDEHVPAPPGPGFGDSIGAHDHRRRDHGRAVPPGAHG